jgi:hypothetical protein
MHDFQLSSTRIAAGVAAAILMLGGTATARADEGPSIEATIKLINGMVAHGALSSERAETMIADARRRIAVAESLKNHGGKPAAEALTPAGVPAAPVVAVAPVPEIAASEMRQQIKQELLAEMRGQMAADLKRQILAELTGSGGAPLPASAGSVSGEPTAAGDKVGGEKGKARVVRVPYVPESMRREIREQVKQEVLTQAKAERWGNPDALPEWLDRFTFEGDMRLRSDSFRLAKDNTPPGVAGNVSGASGLTRGADLSPTALGGVPNVNTQEDFNRTRLRLRFGATAKVAETVSAGFRISTGGTSGPTSTNQTQGQGFNKYSLVLDRGFITLRPAPWLELTGGRIANPFFSTDLVWADDLNFEGFAARFSHWLRPDLNAFVNAGYFPLRTDNPLQARSRDVQGMQAGLNWRLAPASEFKLGAAIYGYHGIEGQVETNGRFGPPAATDYGSRYEYPNGLRQRGNTLFIVNAPADNATGSTNYWGLASGFREFNVTGSLDLGRFDPIHVVLTGDYVRNLAFDERKIAERTGSQIVDARNIGFLGKITVGHPHIKRWGDWNLSLAYRWLGSDAVLDAFTNSDFGLGGTNNKGYILGGSWGIDKNAWISARWMASQLIESMAPKLAGSTKAPTKLSADLLQIDLNAKF